jgi:CDP-diacylglycerol--glycerol-3-phosphate 3-phosphatidyltransferase
VTAGPPATGDADDYVARWSASHGGADPARVPFLRLWLRLMHRLATPLVRWRVSPDAVTLLGLGVAVGAALLAAQGGRWPVAAAVLVASTGVLDGLDGAVAVLSGRTSRWGAVLDAVVDRLAEVSYLVALWTLGAPGTWCVAAGTSTGLLEYVRARAAVAGLAEIGVVSVAERPTRVLIAAMFLLGCGLYPAQAAAWAGAGAGAWAVVGVVGLAQVLGTVRRRLGDGGALSG